MAWRPLGEFVTAVAGDRSVKAPLLPKSDHAAAAALPVDALVAIARARFADAPVAYVQIPGRTDRPVRIRLRLPDDPHPNGLTSVWLDPRTGVVLKAVRWNQRDAGARAVAVGTRCTRANSVGRWVPRAESRGQLR